MDHESEYKELPLNSDLSKRKEYWEVGKGLQKTDGLETSEYLEEVIKDTLTGKYDTQQASERVQKYYETVPADSPGSDTKEADIVAARITLLLEKGGFRFSPVSLLTIHKDLFQGVLPDSWVGVYREVNIKKAEDVLHGESVQYANFDAIRDTLRYDFEEESLVKYSLPFTEDQIKSLAKFTSAIWQTHPFREGNTRTVATFLMLYLQNLGVEINNEPFMKHARYFRDALVRSNYADLKEGIYPDSFFLHLFLENTLIDAANDLNEQDLYCKQLF